jgi:serine/threonine protein phosphatase PrpC
MTLQSSALTDPGCVRADNEDRVLADAGAGFYVVCDGMGGCLR